MTSRKEDEKNERIIRNLLKLADNKRCINCNSLGPQYVCTNFWTFVCTNCSGIHREFTHRVKSISMAKFSSQEVSALQGGGNASAKEIYFKEWDPQRQSLPDGSNVERLRDFIKHVYVERRYSGERSFEKPPRMKMGETEDSYENRRNDSFQSGSRSPPYEDANDRRLSDRPSPGGRSPAYEQDNRQYDKRSPARTEVVNDWRRDDRFGNGRRLDDNRVSDSRSPDSQRDVDVSSPPVVRPVREILGDNVSPLRVLEPPKSNSLRATIDGSLRTQRTASSSSLASSNGNPTETKVEASLIDFDAVPEPPAPPAVLPQQSATGMPVAPAATPGNDNWANFDSVVGVKVSQPPVNTNPLESMLSQLSVPSSTPGNLFGNPGNGTGLPTTSAGTISAFPNTPPVASFGLPFSNVTPPATVVNNLAAFPSGHPVAGPGPLSALSQSGGNSFGNTVTGGQWSQPQAQPVLAAMAGQHLSQPFTSPTIGPASNQPWNPLFAPNSQVLPGVMAPQAPQTVARASLEANPGVASQKFPEVKSSGRSELPADLFTMNYSSMPARVPGWNAGPPFAMGFNMHYNMHYNMPMPTATFAQVPKSTNPFDVNSDPPASQAFPSMASLQGALPNMAASTGLLRTSSLGAPSANPAAMLHNAPPPYPSMMHSNTMMPQLPGNMPVRAPGQGNFGLDAGAFGHLSSNQHMSGLQSVPAPPNNFSTVGGNPFG